MNNTNKENEEIVETFRKQFDELGLKPSKNSMKNLERELIVDYWRKSLLSKDKQIQEAVEAERERIVNEYGYFNDGCGCCMSEDLCKAMTGENSYDREKRLSTQSNNK